MVNDLKQIEPLFGAIVYQPAALTFRSQIGRLWQFFLEQGEQRDSLLNRRRLVSVQRRRWSASQVNLDSY